MGLLDKLLGKQQSQGGKQQSQGAKKELGCQVEFDSEGKVQSIKSPQGNWTLQRKGQNSYYSQKANTLLHATELLKQMGSIPPFAYYSVDTPDGSLARDVNGYYTEAPIKTAKLRVDSTGAGSEAVEFLSLMGFGNVGANQAAAAQLKRTGGYARLVLLMKCGRCDYESPIETQAGDLVRQCYCCGTTNKGHRGQVSVFVGSGMVEI